MEKKHYTYYPEVHKRYNQKRKNIACSVFNAEYEKIKLHAQKKGFKSLNAYVLDLIHRDMNSLDG